MWRWPRRLPLSRLPGRSLPAGRPSSGSWHVCFVRVKLIPPSVCLRTRLAPEYGRKIPLAQRFEARVLHRAILYHIASAGDRVEGFRQADARFLNVAVPAGDGDHVGVKPWVDLQKGLFDHRRRKGDSLLQTAKDRRARNGVIGRARPVVIIGGREARADAMFLPL